MKRSAFLLCLALSGCMEGLQPAAPKPAPTPAPAPAVPTVTERVKATPETVGVKGKEYGGGIITEPLAQRWRMQDRIIIQHVDYALRLYEAAEGRYPASHEEFMEKIVRANNLKLPDLPPGQRYVYDVPTHELLVERTVPAPGGVKP
jgi:hypothetical protein